MTNPSHAPKPDDDAWCGYVALAVSAMSAFCLLGFLVKFGRWAFA